MAGTLAVVGRCCFVPAARELKMPALAPGDQDHPPHLAVSSHLAAAKAELQLWPQVVMPLTAATANQVDWAVVTTALHLQPLPRVDVVWLYHTIALTQDYTMSHGYASITIS